MKKIIVTLDAGHGGSDCHNIGYSKKYYEHISMLKLAFITKDILEKTGNFEVYLTREKDVNLDLFSRCKIAKKHNSDIFISLHTNAGAVQAHGTEVLGSVNRKQDDFFYKILTSNIAQSLGGLTQRPVVYKFNSSGNADYYGILRGAIQMGIPHVVLIESAFHSNKNEEKLLLNDDNLFRIGNAIKDSLNILFKTVDIKNIPNNIKELRVIKETPCYRENNFSSEIVKIFKQNDLITSINENNQFYQTTIGFVPKENCVDRNLKKYIELIVNTSVLNCRKQPNLNSNILKQYKYGDKLTSCNIINGFYELDFGNKKGYVSSKYCQIINEFYK